MLLLKKIAAQLPNRWQVELKRIHYRREIDNGTFMTEEPEYKILHNLVKPGDWVVDIGANVGHYTKRMSEIVGEHGRVIAFEPVPTTFSLLTANVQRFAYPNVSLINAAASDKSTLVGMAIPKFSTGLTNYYEAHISSTGDNALSVLTMPIDSLCLNDKKDITLVKIDAEGHEALVLAGMVKLIKRHRPVLIVETGSKEIIDNLTSLGYISEKLPKSPNILFRPI